MRNGWIRIAGARAGLWAALVASCALPATATAGERRRRPEPDQAAIREAIGRSGTPVRYVSARSLEHYLQARLAREAGDTARAIAELKLAAVYDPQSAWPRFALAEELERAGEPERAEAAAREALGVDARHAPTLILLARLAVAKDRVPAAIDYLQRAAAADPSRAEPFAELVTLHVARGHVAAALAVLDRLDALALNARVRDSRTGGRAQRQAAEALTTAAEAFDARGDHARAEQLLRRAAEREPGNPQRFVRLAELLEARGRLRDAAATWARAGAVAGGAPSHAAAAGKLYLRAGDRATAGAYVEHLAALAQAGTHGATESLLALGHAFLEARAYADARRAFDAAVAAAPDRAEPRYYQGAALEALGELQPALEAYARVPDGHGLAPDARARAALCEHRLGRGDPAATLRDVLAAHPHHVEASLTLARVLEERGDVAGARATLEALPEDARTPAVIVTLARLHRRLGAPASGLALLEAALSRAPDDAALAYARAFELSASDEPAKALEAARTLVAREPRHADALNLAAWLLVETGGPLAEAEVLVTRALALQPDEPGYLDTLGCVLLRKGEVRAAIEALSRAAAAAPKHAAVCAHLAEARARAGEVESARGLYEQARQLAAAQGDAALADRAARALEALGRAGDRPPPASPAIP